PTPRHLPAAVALAAVAHPRRAAGHPHSGANRHPHSHGHQLVLAAPEPRTGLAARRRQGRPRAVYVVQSRQRRPRVADPIGGWRPVTPLMATTGPPLLPYFRGGVLFLAFFSPIRAIEGGMLLPRAPPWRRYGPDDRLPWEQEEGEREPWER